jgi:hypothetical protein
MPVRILIAALALTGASALGQTKTQPGAEVQMILTVADHMNHKPAALKAEDVSVLGATVTDLVPIEGGRELELYLVIDDAANYDFGSKLQELRQFATAQPTLTAIGVAYIHDGTLEIVENPTTDRARVARGLRPPAGSKAANPYCAISDLIERWPKKTLRREIVLVSTGIDDSATEGAVCVNAEMAIHDAERAGVTVYALYNPVTNYLSEKWSKVDSGVVDLAHVCYETGGEAYFMGHSPADSIAPFLADISEHLAHQYLVKFRVPARPEGAFQTIYVSSPSYDREFMKPESVWVPGTHR